MIGSVIAMLFVVAAFVAILVHIAKSSSVPLWVPVLFLVVATLIGLPPTGLAVFIK